MSKGILDELDISIIKNLWNKESTTTELAKIIFKTVKKREVQDKTSFIHKRMEKLLSVGIVKRLNNGFKNTYSLNLKNFLFGIRFNKQIVIVPFEV